MEMSMGSREDPAILQLHKWGSSEAQLNLSEFHEAFLSPTRQTLLLLSYQHEALLVPLITGDSHGSDSKSSHDRYSNHGPGVSTHCSQELTRPSRSEWVNDVPCTSGSEIQFDSYPTETKCSRSDSFPFISDANSFTCGLCGENYDQHGDASFGELLFVSGRCGVTVHAFSKLNKSRGMVQGFRLH
ncbi:hypothetical protein QN277_023028 [Acacia crassicarpa]|uniref:Uncharacterized protein n=1 Tax=Acacia crassicarpa TaxID=499986 RepID=A0AAE1MLL1_9FABA|nr:hypothetical protein QN277_023028 [Acacia crassicarpa]